MCAQKPDWDCCGSWLRVALDFNSTDTMTDSQLDSKARCGRLKKCHMYQEHIINHVVVTIKYKINVSFCSHRAA